MYFFRNTLYLDILPNRKYPGPNRNHLQYLVLCVRSRWVPKWYVQFPLHPGLMVTEGSLATWSITSIWILTWFLFSDVPSRCWFFHDSFTLEIIGTTMKNLSMQSTSKYHLDPFGVVSHSEILCFKNPNVHPDFTAVSLSHRFPFLILAIRRDALPQTVKWSF